MPYDECIDLNRSIAEREKIFTAEIWDLAVSAGMIDYWYCYNQDNTKNMCNPFI